MDTRVSTPMTRQQALRSRLVCQGLGTARSRGAGAVDTVRSLISLPVRHAAHAIGLRSVATAEDVQSDLDQAELVSVNVFRPRPQLVAASDVRWLQELTSAHVERSHAADLAEMGLTPRVIGTSMYALADLLSDSNRMTAAQMSPQLAAHGLPHEGRPYRALLAVASLRGLLCHVADGYLLTDDLLPTQPRLDQDEALEELARRFYLGHGPSSLGDFARWSGLPLSLARRGTQAAAEDLHVYDIDDLVHYGPRVLLSVNGGSTLLVTLNDEAIRPYPDLPYLSDRPTPPGADGVILDEVHVAGSFRFDESAPGGVAAQRYSAADEQTFTRRQAR